MTRMIRTTIPLALAWALAGCAAAPEAPPAPPQAATPAPASTPAAAEPAPPRVVNTLGYPHLTLAGVDRFGEYTSLALKISYRIDASGALQALDSGHEPMLNETHAVADDRRCMDYGGGYNQRTVWFPDTGLFVAGARLVSVRTARGQPWPLKRLTADDSGAMAVAGAEARPTEYGYVPCVGRQRVREGARGVGYLPPGARLLLQPEGRGARPVELQLPSHPRPFVELNYADRAARALVPAHVVLLTVDWPARRAVVQYQVTLPMRPQVATARWLSTASPAEAERHEAARRYNDAVQTYLATCPPPNKPMDPCANPHGLPPPAWPRP
jgi:hypothetical protein